MYFFFRLDRLLPPHTHPTGEERASSFTSIAAASFEFVTDAQQVLWTTALTVLGRISSSLPILNEGKVSGANYALVDRSLWRLFQADSAKGPPRTSKDKLSITSLCGSWLFVS